MDIEKRYRSGEMIPAKDFREEDGGLKLFGEVVWNDFKRGEDVGQFDLDGELWHRKVHPEVIMTEEQEHLLRTDDRNR